MRKVSSKRLIAAGLCCSLVITTVGCSTANNANREVPQVETLASDTDASSNSGYFQPRRQAGN